MKEKGANTYFTKSGCLTVEALEEFRLGSLAKKDMAITKSHLSGCELCSEAFEGIQLLSDKESIKDTIAELNQSLTEELLIKNPKNQPTKPTGKLFYYSAAASILILIGFLFYLNFPAHKLSMDTTDFIIEENSELPTPPVPPNTKGKKANTQKRISINAKKSNAPKTPTGEKLKHITVNFSEIEDEDFFNEELEISMDNTGIASIQKPNSIDPESPEGFLMDMIVISEANAKSGPSPMEQHLQMSEVDDTRKESEKEPEEAIFAIVETMPQFPGGELGLRNYLQENLNYPAKARKAGIEGKVYVSFVVNSAGKVAECKVIKGIGNNCDIEALQVINNMPFWKPATQQGRPVSVRFVIPVFFKLN